MIHKASYFYTAAVLLSMFGTSLAHQNNILKHKSNSSSDSSRNVSKSINATPKTDVRLSTNSPASQTKLPSEAIATQAPVLSTKSASNVPTTVPTAKPVLPTPGTGSFDGTSFFGGFVLAVGLAVIGLVVYKVCFNRSTGPNYSHF